MIYLIDFLKKKKLILLLVLIASILEAVGALLVPRFSAEMINTVIMPGSHMGEILFIGLKMLIAAGATALVMLINSYLSADLAALSAKHLRRLLIAKTQELSIKDFNAFGTPAMITRTTSDISIIQQAIIMITQMILPAPLILAASVVMTYLEAPQLAYISLASIVALFIGAYVLFIKSTPISKTMQRKMEVINRIVRESIVGIRVIRAFDHAVEEQKRAEDAFSQYAENVIRLNRTVAAFAPLIWMIMGFAMTAVMWFGGYFVLEGSLPIGSITAISEYVILMLMYLMMAVMSFVMIPKALVSLDRVKEVLDIRGEIQDGADGGGEGLVFDEKVLVFRHVSFSYEGAEMPILEDLSFVCERGKTTAIIGGTGSGKSTMGRLMLRLYDIQKGEILFGGKDVRQISQHRLRQEISYIPQKSFLFSGTIADNLSMGNRLATPVEIQHAAEIAQADHFIQEIDQQYDSPVARGGSNFSGGQKQRLCIARGLVRKAQLYIFDDTFSALDVKTDAALRAALKEELKDAAVVVIAQRISTIMEASQIIVLDAGKIVGIGSHEQLMKSCSVYQDIAYSQLTEEEVSNHE